MGLRASTALVAATLAALVIASGASAQVGGAPIIAGDPVVGETLTSSSAGTLGSYKWQRCDPVGPCGASAGDTNWVDIPGAISQTYTIPAADLGYLIRVNTRQLSPFWTPSDPVGPVTMPPGPEAHTGVASEITDTAATLNGAVDPNGSATSYHFEYGIDDTYGTEVPVPDGGAGSGDGNIDVSATITGLAPDTTYHFRLVAQSASGTSEGDDRTFTTEAVPPPPEAATGAATAIGVTTATLNGAVDPNGRSTSYRFEYGTDAGYGSQAPVPDGSAGAGFVDQGVSAAITGLQPSTTYHFRLVAESTAGMSEGVDQTFTTGAPPPPTAQHGISLFGEKTGGTVTYKPPGASGFQPLQSVELIPVGSVIDTRQGRIEMTAATGPYANTTPDQSMEYYQGIFRIQQSPKRDSLAIARLVGPRVCGPFVHRQARASQSGPTAVAARRGGRRLWSSGRGRYGTAGRGGTGSVRGTTYLTEEKCNGTYFKVSDEPGPHGIDVKVRGKKKPVFLGPGDAFLAPR